MKNICIIDFIGGTTAWHKVSISFSLEEKVGSQQINALELYRKIWFPRCSDITYEKVKKTFGAIPVKENFYYTCIEEQDINGCLKNGVGNRDYTVKTITLDEMIEKIFKHQMELYKK